MKRHLPDKAWYRIDEIADHFQVSPKTVYGWISRGVLKSHRVGGGLRISRAEWQRQLEKFKEQVARAEEMRSKNKKPTKITELNTISDAFILHQYNAVQFPSCIYFLCKDKEIVYVGQTVNLPARSVCHINSIKEFDEIFYVEVSRDKLSSIEKMFIRAIKPKYNRCRGS